MRILIYFHYKHVSSCLTWLAVLHNARPGEHRECVLCSGSISECFRHTHLSLSFFSLSRKRAHILIFIPKHSQTHILPLR